VFKPRRLEDRVDWRVKVPLVAVPVAECDAVADGVVELSLGGVAGFAVSGVAVGREARTLPM
jgi:hypothetical protein